MLGSKGMISTVASFNVWKGSSRKRSSREARLSHFARMTPPFLGIRLPDARKIPSAYPFLATQHEQVSLHRFHRVVLYRSKRQCKPWSSFASQLGFMPFVGTAYAAPLLSPGIVITFMCILILISGSGLGQHVMHHRKKPIMPAVFYRIATDNDDFPWKSEC